jgi:uncharacterized caspase-like protein
MFSFVRTFARSLSATARLGLLAVAVVASSASFAEASGRRVAIAIGVSAYQSSPLRSPVRDAQVFGEELSRFGFDVTVVRDPGVTAFTRALEQFIESARGADMAVVYYSGHGLQVNGVDYFIPRDAEFGADLSLFRRDFMSVNSVLARLDQAGVRFRMVITDACRSNPFATNGGMAFEHALTTAGLNESLQLGTHAVAAYSSAPGQNSQDWYGTLGLSLYTAGLVEAMRRHDRVEIRDLLQEARGMTQKTANARRAEPQQPWEMMSMVRPEYLVRVAPRAIARTAETPVRTTAR